MGYLNFFHTGPLRQTGSTHISLYPLWTPPAKYHTTGGGWDPSTHFHLPSGGCGGLIGQSNPPQGSVAQLPKLVFFN
jgi:hypothetical protein